MNPYGKHGKGYDFTLEYARVSSKEGGYLNGPFVATKHGG